MTTKIKKNTHNIEPEFKFCGVIMKDDENKVIKQGEWKDDN